MVDTGGSGRIGIDLGGTKIAGILLSHDGRVQTQARLATPPQDYAATVRAVAELVHQLDPDDACLVGVGTPGSVIPASGLMHNCNSTWLNGQPLLSDLNKLLGGRVRIANDADCFALSEARDGSGAGAASVFGVILGTGVGGGLVFDGALLRGAGGLAGEWGHNPMPLDSISWPEDTKSRLCSRQCYCGELNCVETYLSGPGLAATHQALWAEDRTAAAIYQQAIAGNVADEQALSSMLSQTIMQLDRCKIGDATSALSRARCSLAIYCTMLVRALAGVVNVLDPEVIVLGGGLSKMQAIYQPTQHALIQQVFGHRGATQLKAPKYGDASGVRGAAWLWDSSQRRGRESEKDK